MAEIGDKAFTTEMVQEIKRAVMAELGTNAFVKRYLATVSAVNTTTSEVTVYLSGSDITSSSFYARGILLPSVGDQVVACIDGSDRWIEDVIRPQTATPYITFATAAAVPTGSIVAWLTTTAPTGWLFCDGATYAYNTYPVLGALRGGSAGGNFTVPDLRDRFIAANAVVSSAWSNNTGTFSPNAAIADHTHTFTGTAHSHDIAHGHADTFAVSNHASHTHSVDPTAFTSGSASVAGAGQSGSGITYSTGGHTHSIDVPATTSGGPSATLTHSVTGSVTNLGSTQSVITTATGTNSIDDWTAAQSTAKSSLLNFIIKT